MKRINLLVIVALTAGLIMGSLLLAAKPALAVDVASCAAVNAICTSVSATECTISDLRNLTSVGTFTCTVDRILHIDGASAELRTGAATNFTLNIAGGSPAGLIIENGGKITGNTSGATGVGATININVASGDVILAESGATISAQNTAGGGCGSGHGGVINLTANGENAKITTEDGTTISVNGDTCSAGAINISAPNKGSIDIDGDVLSQSNKSGSGTANSGATPPLGGTQPPGGGPIFITAACDLTISDTGFVSSRGRDPGADLVHLQGGCDVLINGYVESAGTGHAPPGNPPNSCTNVTPHAGSVRRNPATRPGKPFNSTACVEVWAGNSLIINKDSLGNNGEINADTGASPGGSEGTSWIDLFARGDIKVLNTTATWAVHANGNAGTDNGGVVTVKSAGTGPVASPGNIILNGLALQANAAAAGTGGTVDVEALLDIDLSSGRLEAKSGGTASTGNGGRIIVHSFSEDILSDLLSVLDVTGHNPANGHVDLTACKTIGFPPGTILPAILPAANITKSPLTCGVGPTFPSAALGQYDVILPDCPCGERPPDGGTCEKAAVKSVLNSVTGRFPGNLGPDLTFRLDLGQDEDGNTSIQQSIDNVTDKNNDKYLIVLVVKDGTGQLGGSRTESIVINRAYEERFGLFACSVTLKDENTGDGQPTALIAVSASSPAGSLENIFVMDLHGADSDLAGWLVEGNGRYMRNVANKNNRIGIWFVGNNNIMHNGNATDNLGVGIQVDGSGNLVDSSDSFGNGGDGIHVVGNGNTIKKVDAGDKGKGNGGDGINVNGNSNYLQENDLYANSGDGLQVTGNGNTLLKNRAGDAKKGNGGDGINVSGAGNLLQENQSYADVGDGVEVSGGTAGSPNRLYKNKSGDRGDKANGGNGFWLHDDTGNGNVNPIELEENTATGNKLNGFLVSGTGHQLKKNESGGSGSGYPNGVCQYDVAAGNVNNTGNKSNGTTIAGANGSAFPTGCK